jgi:hypothetical protein
MMFGKPLFSLSTRPSMMTNDALRMRRTRRRRLARTESLMVQSIVKYGYPPDLRDEATKTVLRQAEVLAEEWAA